MKLVGFSWGSTFDLGSTKPSWTAPEIKFQLSTLKTMLIQRKQNNSSTYAGQNRTLLCYVLKGTSLLPGGPEPEGFWIVLHNHQILVQTNQVSRTNLHKYTWDFRRALKFKTK